MVAETGFKALSASVLECDSVKPVSACFSFPDVEDKRDVMVKEVVMSFADSSCLV